MRMYHFLSFLMVLILFLGCKSDDGSIDVKGGSGGGGGGEGSASYDNRIATGDNHSCFLTAAGQVKCWGWNNTGMLGYDDNVDRATVAGPNDMSNLTWVDLGGTAKSIDAGFKFTCALMTAGTVKCWGLNTSGQLGQDTVDTAIGDTGGDMAGLTTINFGGTATQMSVGYDHVCVVLTDDTVKCWGDNAAGELGQNNTTDVGDATTSVTSIPVVGLSSIKSVSAGKNTTCVIFDDNQVKCWGYGSSGALGQNSGSHFGNSSGANAVDQSQFAILGSGRTATYLDGSEHTCAVLDNGNAKCWGYNNNGQLGQDSATSIIGTSPSDMESLVEIDFTADITQIATGAYHTCALLADGNVRCWGDNTYGQLGYNDINDRGATGGDMAALVDINFGNGKEVVEIQAGDNHNCVRFDDDTMRCWGYNLKGQLGQDSTTTYGANGVNRVDTLADIVL